MILYPEKGKFVGLMICLGQNTQQAAPRQLVPKIKIPSSKCKPAFQ